MHQTKRQVAMDIETSGISPSEGHRIIEIAAIEILDGKVTGSRFCRRINPEREIEEEVSSITGMTWGNLRNEPRFAEIAADFLEFIRGAELIMHCAPFDLGFLSAELALAGLPALTNPVIDTWEMAWNLHPSQDIHLDALCKCYHIDQTQPAWYGLLSDAEAIADVYLAMSAAWHVVSAGVSPDMHRGKLLDLAEARGFVDNYQVTEEAYELDLSAYKRVTPSAIGFLALQESYYEFDVVLGIECLDDYVANALVQWSPCCIIFEDLRCLSESVILIFSKSYSYLKFRNLNEISALTAKLLAGIQLLNLRLENISMEVANELIKQDGELSLSLISPPDESILHVLSHHAGSGITIHWQSPEDGEPFVARLPIGKELRSRNSSFITSTGRRNESMSIVQSIDGGAEIPEAQQREFKHLDLAEALRLCEEKGSDISSEEMSSGMELSMYSSATDDALEFLASHIKNDYLYLKLPELNADVAKILCRWDAYIEFHNVERLDLETALILSERIKGISFHSPSFQIDAEIARALAKLRPSLGLALGELSEDLAQELIKKPGHLWLWVETPPSEKVLHMLCGHMGSWLTLSWIGEVGVKHCNFKPSSEILERKEVAISFSLSTSGEWIEQVSVHEFERAE